MTVERRRVAGARVRARIARDQRSAPFRQAELSVYVAGVLLFLFLIAFSLQARDELPAFAVAFQAGSVLLLSPEVLRPLRRIQYFSRPLWVIRARRRRVLRRGLIAFAVLVALATARAVDFDGAGSDSRLVGAIVLLLGLFCGPYLLYLSGAWVIEMLFESAAETWVQELVRRMGSEQADELRRAFAGMFFFIGTLLTFYAAYA